MTPKSLPTKEDALQCAISKYLKENKEDIVYFYRGNNPQIFPEKLKKNIQCAPMEGEESLYGLSVDCESIAFRISENLTEIYPTNLSHYFKIAFIADVKLDGDEKEGFTAEIRLIKDNVIKISTSDPFLENLLNK